MDPDKFHTKITQLYCHFDYPEERCIEFIYELFYELIRVEDYKLIDELLYGIKYKELEASLLLSILTATFSVKDKLKYRSMFYFLIKMDIGNRYSDECLQGLE